MLRNIGGRADHHHALVAHDGDGDHVLRHGLGDTDACVKALPDDVDKATLGYQHEFHVGVAAQILQDDRRQDHPGGACRGVDAQGSGRRVAVGVDALDRAADLGQRGADTGDELFARIGHRNAARGAVEQAHTQPRLQRRHRMAERGAGHAKLVSGGTKATQTRNSNHGVEFVQAVLSIVLPFSSLHANLSDLLGRS